jgi:hypothetical protein
MTATRLDVFTDLILTASSDSYGRPPNSQWCTSMSSYRSSVRMASAASGPGARTGAAVPRAEDFRGLRHVAERLGESFVVGAVLYTGRETLPFGPRFRAIPISALWETAPAS